MDSADNNTPTRQNVLCKQPISCPWINSQPYPATQNKNKVCTSAGSKCVVSFTILVNLF